MFLGVLVVNQSNFQIYLVNPTTPSILSTLTRVKVLLFSEFDLFCLFALFLSFGQFCIIWSQYVMWLAVQYGQC